MTQVVCGCSVKPGVKLYLPVPASTTCMVKVVTPPHTAGLPVPDVLNWNTFGSRWSGPLEGQSGWLVSPQDGVKKMSLTASACSSPTFSVLFHLICKLPDRVFCPCCTVAGKVGVSATEVPASAAIGARKNPPR